MFEKDAKAYQFAIVTVIVAIFVAAFSFIVRIQADADGFEDVSACCSRTYRANNNIVCERAYTITHTPKRLPNDFCFMRPDAHLCKVIQKDYARFNKESESLFELVDSLQSLK